MTCQTCGHESVRFDPFNLLSLPLPMESYTLCEVLGNYCFFVLRTHTFLISFQVLSNFFLVVRLSGEVPIKYGLRLNSEAKYIELKQQLHRLCNIKTERLLLAELDDSQIRQVLNDDVRINPSTATKLYAYELPEDHQDIEEMSNDVGKLDNVFQFSDFSMDILIVFRCGGCRF